MPEVAESVRIAVRLLVEMGAVTDGEAELLLLVAKGAIARRALNAHASKGGVSAETRQLLKRMVRDGALASEELLEEKPALVLSMVSRVDTPDTTATVDDVAREGVMALVRSIERYSISNAAESEGRKICDQVIREVYLAVRQAAARAHANVSNSPDATNFERHMDPETIGQIEIVPLENADEGDVSCSDGTLEKLLDEESLEEIRAYVKAYRPKLWEIIEYRFGLVDGVPHSLDETAAAFEMTRERIRQWEMGFFHLGFAIDHDGKIKRKNPHARRGSLKDFTDDSD